MNANHENALDVMIRIMTLQSKMLKQAMQK
jgi:hypothetical protein